MKVSRQPRASALLRITAGTCALLWLVGIVVCGMGRLCNCSDHEEACAIHASQVHEHDAASPHDQGHSQEAKGHEDVKRHEQAAASRHNDNRASQADHGCKGEMSGDEKACCSTIQAFIVTPTPIVVAKPVLQPLLHISLLRAVRQPVLAAPPSGTFRRAKPRDWVLTPEVCLGPAFRSLAPPSLT